MTQSSHLKKLVLAGAVLMAAVFSSCEKIPENKETPVQSVSIAGAESGGLTLQLKGGAQVFPVSLSPAGADVKNLSASSSDPSVAKAEIKLLRTKAAAFDAELTITPLSGGETDITVSADGVKSVMHLTVEEEPIFAITGDVSGISSGQVYCGMSMVNSDKLPAFSSYVMGGVCYSSVNKTPVVPTVKDGSSDKHDCEIAFGKVFKAGEKPVDGEYNDIQLTTLKPSTEYFYRAFVWIDESETVYYGELKSFRTSDTPIIAAGEVDLGLSVNWWGCNIGASKPEEYGNYYAWGETAEKDKYTVGNYTLRYSKYHTTQREEGHFDSSIKIDNKTILEAGDDIATITLGEGWRMPTVEEIRELKDLNPSAYELNGVKGLLFTGKNGNSMFIPYNGMKKDSESLYQGVHLMLWSCKASVDDAIRAGAFETESQWGAILNTYAYRFVGMGVRGVRGSRPKDGPDITYTDFSATEITTNSATISLTVNIDDAELSEEGVGLQVSSSPDFKELTAEKSNGKQGGKISMELTGLSPACKYYVRAYVGTVTNGLYTGESFTFQTESDTIEPFVDMGTGVLWASWDFGSDKPETKGTLFAWGETETKEEFTAKNNKYYNTMQNGRYVYKKYNKSDKLTTLQASDDAIKAALGDSYRTPTIDDWTELLVNCTKAVGSRNGVDGWILTSKITGKYLFFPNGNYMSASIRMNVADDKTYYNMIYAPCQTIKIYDTKEKQEEWMSSAERYEGLPIRYVRVKE